MATISFKMTPYLEEARGRVTEQFMLEPVGIPTPPPPPQSGYDWFLNTYGISFTNMFSDKLQHLVNEKYVDITQGGM